MADVRDVKVSVSLKEYTDLVCIKNDFERIKAYVEKCTDRYLGSTEIALIKALCGINGKEKDDDSEKADS